MISVHGMTFQILTLVTQLLFTQILEDVDADVSRHYVRLMTFRLLLNSILTFRLLRRDAVCIMPSASSSSSDAVAAESDNIVLMTCQSKSSNVWSYNYSHLALRNEQGLCLDGSTMKLVKCRIDDPNQKWNFSNYNSKGLNFANLHY